MDGGQKMFVWMVGLLLAFALALAVTDRLLPLDAKDAASRHVTG